MGYWNLVKGEMNQRRWGSPPRHRETELHSPSHGQVHSGEQQLGATGDLSPDFLEPAKSASCV